jgi:hypothetical protein
MDNFDLKKYLAENKLNEENIPFPSWYDNFVQQFSNKFGVEVEDLDFEMVDPHLMGINAFNFSQKGMDIFPTIVRSVLKQPEFAGKAIMVWDNTGKIESRLAEKHPELEDYLGNDEMFWIYIK